MYLQYLSMYVDGNLIGKHTLNVPSESPDCHLSHGMVGELGAAKAQLNKIMGSISRLN